MIEAIRSEDRERRSIDLYRRPEGLGIARIAEGKILLEDLDTYLEGLYPTNDENTAAEAFASQDRFMQSLMPEPGESAWPLPDEPSTPLREWEAGHGPLLEALAELFAKNVIGPPPRPLATWTLAASVPEIAMYAPPTAFLGPPGSGKSRSIAVLRAVVRRGMYLAVPSSASLYALTHRLQPTLCVDEWTRLSQDIRSAIEGILRVGFERMGAYIPRRKEHSEDVRFWRAFGFYALGSREPLVDDVMDRSLPNVMIESHDVPDFLPEDPHVRELRTTVVRFRLEVLAKTCPRQPVDNARTQVRTALKDRRIRDRSLDKASALGAIAIPYAALEDVIATVIAAEQEARVQHGWTTEGLIVRAIARIFNGTPMNPDALQAVQIGKPTVITMKNLHDEIWSELVEMGYRTHQLELDDPVLPQNLGKMVRNMGVDVDHTREGSVIKDGALQAKLDALAWKYREDLPAQARVDAKTLRAVQDVLRGHGGPLRRSDIAQLAHVEEADAERALRALWVQGAIYERDDGFYPSD